MNDCLLLSPCEEHEKLIIPETTGLKRLSDFSSETIDFSQSFCDWGFDVDSLPKEGATASLHELNYDATVRDAFKFLGEDQDAIALTPMQAGKMIHEHREFFLKVGRSSFFLLSKKTKICGVILTPHESGYISVRPYLLTSEYIIRRDSRYLFIAI